jgi:fructose-bisphosphate aldolase class II
MVKVLDVVKPGVLLGKDVDKVFEVARKEGFAIPAVNVTNSSTINAALLAAKEVNSPIIIQVSHGGSAFFAGKGIDNSDHRASILGAKVMAEQVHILAKEYGVPVMVHSDHCAKKLLPWLDGMLKLDKEHVKKTKKPLFSSHMIDLSAESLKDNVKITKKYLKKFSELGITLEVEIGVTGGEEDGVDNTSVDNKRLYTQPEDIEYAYREFTKISKKFTIAATFGNVHGVYKPGNVKLKPIILKNIQNHIKETFKLKDEKPINLVFHGSSGSKHSEIKKAVEFGVVKLNIDTDCQWAYWDGVRNYEKKYHEFLQSQIGNPNGEELPNKKYYDPRSWLGEAEISMKNRLIEAFKDLNCINRN